MRKLSACIGALALVPLAFVGCGENPTEISVADLDASLVGLEKNKGKIVFHHAGDIWVMNADGSGKKNLTNSPAAIDIEPTWSRNGKEIVFTSNRRSPGAPFLKKDVWLMNADGSDQRRVTTTTASDFNPHVSPNGQQIVFFRGQQPPPFPGAVPQIFVINVDGTGETNLTNNSVPGCFPFGPPPCVFEAFPRWSPNGKQILFNRATSPGDADIFVMNGDGSGRTNITNSPGVNDFFASWSPNGKKIAFSSGVPFGPDARPEDIYVMNIDGSGLRQVTEGEERDIAPDWSPNGKQLVFYQELGPPSFLPTDVFTINVDGTNLLQLTTSPEPDAFPGWASGPVR